MLRLIEIFLSLFIFLIPWQARWVVRVGEIGSPSTGSGSNFWEYGTAALYATDVLFFTMALLAGVWLWKERNRTSSIVNGQVSVVSCLLFLLGYVFLSVFWAPHQVIAVYAAFKLLQGVVLFLLLRVLPVDHKKLIWAFIASAVAQSLLAIIQFATQSVAPFEWSGVAPHAAWLSGGPAVVETAVGRWLRTYGTFPHPNLLGAFLAVALIVLFSKSRINPSHPPFLKREENPPPFLKGDRGGFSHVLFAICNLLLATALFLTFSRSAWLAVLVGLLWWFVTTKAWRNRFTRQTLILLTTYNLLLITIFFPLVMTRLSLSGRLETKSTVERIAGYHEAWQLMKAHPILGVGIGNYTVAVHNELRPGKPAWTYQPVHNLFVLVLTELGLIGFAVFAWFLFQVSKKWSPITSHRSPHHSKLGTGQALITDHWLLVTLAILASFDHSFWTLQSGILLFWLTLAFFDQDIVDNV